MNQPDQLLLWQTAIADYAAGFLTLLEQYYCVSAQFSSCSCVLFMAVGFGFLWLTWSFLIYL
jgi:hypothetical protein